MFITKAELYIVIFSLILSALFFSGGILLRKIDSKKAKKDKEIEDQKRMQAELKRNDYENTLSKLSAKFGECTINEILSLKNSLYNISSRVLVYEQSSIIVIKSKEYKFSDILGYSLVDDATKETITTSEGSAKTSTGNMFGRAVVGGDLMGGIGAVAGAATAKKNISIGGESVTTTHKYTLYVNVDNLQEPTISLNVGNNTSMAQKLAGVLNIIVERNRQIKNASH